MGENEVSSRDYYNDLELRPDAEYDQIRSQYKKLSLRFHPDKNRGKEDEYNSKFQVIQKAYEILKDPTKRLTYDRQRNLEAEGARRSANGSSNPHPPGPSTASQKEKPRPASGFGKAQNTSRPERPSCQPGRRPPTAGSSKSYERGSQQTGPGNGRGGFGIGPQTASPFKNPIFGAQSHRGGRKREGKRPTGSGSSPRRHPSPIRTSQPGEFDGSNPTKERPTGFDPNGSREDERMAPQGVSGYRISEPSTLWDNQETVYDEGTSMPEPDKPGASRKTFNEGCSPQMDDPRSAPLKRKRKLIFTDLNTKFGGIIQGEVRLEIYSDEDDEIDYPQSIGDLNP